MSQTRPAPALGAAGEEASTIRAVAWRLMPILLASYVVAYVDRINVGFAALTANADLGLSPTVYAQGAGVFFLGYALFEVPSNLLLARVGARRWIARIMLTWGVIAGGMAFVTGASGFAGMRFLLGLAEAGFFPGIIFYLGQWFPAAHRARYMGLFVIGIPLASFLGAPISGALLGLDGWLGLKGWQWLYLLEAAPAILLGLVILFVLPDRPAEARFLSPARRAWLADEIERERAGRPEAARLRLSMLLRGRTILLTLLFLANTSASYGVSFWLPQIVKAWGGTNFQTGLLTAIPPGISCFAVIAWGISSDRSGERILHTLAAAIASGAGLLLAIATTSPALQLAALSLALCGIYALKAPFWALVTESYVPADRAAVIAAINSIGNLGGYLGPYVMGLGKEMTGGFVAGLAGLAAFALASGALALLPVLRRAPDER